MQMTLSSLSNLLKKKFAIPLSTPLAKLCETQRLLVNIQRRILSTFPNQLESTQTKQPTRMSHTLHFRTNPSHLPFIISHKLLPTIFFLPPSLPSSGFCRLFLHFCRHGNIAGGFPIQPLPRQLPPPPSCGSCLSHLRSIVFERAARGVF